MVVIKRDGKKVEFDKSKIASAIMKAIESTPDTEATQWDANWIADMVTTEIEGLGRQVEVEEIQDIVEKTLMNCCDNDVAINYIRYRYQHELDRKGDATVSNILSLIERDNENIKQENSNKDPIINSTQRDYMAGEISKSISKKFLIPEDIWKAHEDGIIHFHDTDYFAQHMHNCCLVNLEDMLQNGTVISGTKIDRPHSFSTACNIATQIIAQVASSQYGGQTITLSHLAPFVDVSRKRIREQVISEFMDMSEMIPELIDIDATELEGIIQDRISKRLQEEISRGVQTLQYQIITLMTTNGQAPFVTVYMDINEVDEDMRDDLVLIIREVLRQRIEGVKNEQNVFITPAFPKLIYALDENNIHEGSEYFWLTTLAAVCTAKRMVPDYISRKKMKELKIDANGNGQVYPSMGCRSFLTPYLTPDGKPKYYGRFNQGVVTLNLVDVACSSKRNIDEFFNILDDRLELCYRALMIRHERLLGTPSDVAPILWQNGAIARLKKGEVIDDLLTGGYSTISLGYAGLAECVYFLTGKSHTTDEGKGLGLNIMRRMNDKCAEWKAATKIDFSLYGTPIESTTYKFAKKLQKRFGIIPHVTDKSYITNSYHIHVTEPIDAFTKLTIESDFQALSPGGAISYVEVPNMQNNIPAVLAVVRHIYNNILYAELNTKSDYCHNCGYSGEIKIVRDGNDMLVWKCPVCGNRDQTKMNVARRTCGYIGSNFWNFGRTEEIADRVLHL